MKTNLIKLPWSICVCVCKRWGGGAGGKPVLWVYIWRSNSVPVFFFFYHVPTFVTEKSWDGWVVIQFHKLCQPVNRPPSAHPPLLRSRTGSGREGNVWKDLWPTAIKQNICKISKQTPVNDMWSSLCFQTTRKTALKDRSRIKLFFHHYPY